MKPEKYLGREKFSGKSEGIRISRKWFYVGIIAVVIFGLIGGYFLLIGGGGEGTFPSTVGQSLTYEVESGENYVLEVKAKSTHNSHEVFKIDIKGVILIHPAEFFADKSGRVWESNWYGGNENVTYDYDTNTYNIPISGESGPLPEDFVPIAQVYMGAWWKRLNLSPGKNFTIKRGAVDPKNSVTVNFNVEKVETINVPAGSFKAFVVHGESTEGRLTFWIDKSTGILIKSTGIFLGGIPVGPSFELARMNGF